jgi:type III restriction enzyme
VTRLYLEEMVGDVDFDSLPAAWTEFDLANFSPSRKLWDYQQHAVENAIKALWKYYADFRGYEPQEPPETNAERRAALFQWYADNGLEDDLDIQVPGDHRLRALLTEYYDIEEGKIAYQQLINRASFWMATGSGKTLVLIKLIEVLRSLVQRGEIPPNDILVLTSRDDLIEQLHEQVRDFQTVRGDMFIHLRELREYAEAKRHNPRLFKDQEFTVFYYRADNLSDEQKDRIIDFRNYENNGKWYVLLDEAHKGDREDSKRQHIYSILSRNGFLFNFSATFTDPRDWATTVYNFNLSEFTRAGYGKHVTVLKQDFQAFQDESDFSTETKQTIVLKSLLMLACARRSHEEIQAAGDGLYHRPLLVSLVNSVNPEDSDLELYFRELERIAKGEVDEETFKRAKEELWQELREEPPVMFHDGETLKVSGQLFSDLDLESVLETVFNANTPGEIEISIRPSKDKEFALKLKTSASAFALVSIGSTSIWLTEKLAGYETTEGFESEGYFETLNSSGSPINILMGSRRFYEGWDSNRPNVMNFINIGMGVDARKFILQAIGRGVRIRPVVDERKRLKHLYNAGKVPGDLFAALKDKVSPMETLVVLGTKRKALQAVIGELEQQSRRDYQQLSLFKNPAAKGRSLLIPTYRQVATTVDKSAKGVRFEIEVDEFELLKRYVGYVSDPRVLMARYDTSPKKVGLLSESFEEQDRFYKNSDRRYRNIDLLTKGVFDYFDVRPEELDNLKELEDEINHFEDIKVALEDIGELEDKVQLVLNFEDPEETKADLKGKFEAREIDLEEYTRGIEDTTKMLREPKADYQIHGKKLEIRLVANHYYVPMILSGERERIAYIKHIIQTPSEIDFLNHLEEYLKTTGNKLAQFDWWMFSKLDEHLDNVYIPYYGGKSNKMRQFKPDFVFWLQRGSDYCIVFIDPKSTTYADYGHKMDGYSALFEESGNPREFSHGELAVKVLAFLRTDDTDKLSNQYKRFWFEDIDRILAQVVA